MQAHAAKRERGVARDLAALAASAVEEVFLWPCNAVAWECWQALQSQWRIGMAGRSGLDYAAAVAYLRHVRGLAGEPLRDVFDGLQACEAAVLQLQAESSE